MDRKKVEKKVFIKELVEGQQVRELFAVSRKNLAETKNGKPYLALSLMDKTGEIEARLWDDAEHFAPLAEEGAFVLVTAVVKSYREQLQLGVTSLEQFSSEQVFLGHFFPSSDRDPQDMEKELKLRIRAIRDVGLHKLLAVIFQGDVLEQFLKAPAAKKMHHAYIGGLAEHSLSIAAMAEKTAEHYPLLDKDMLVAGSLLHDLAKIREFDFSSLPFNYTDQGRLVGHLVLGVEMVREASSVISEMSQERTDQLCHLILSHHGQLEYGSPVLPMTPEAMLLHHLDDMDAKMNYVQRLQSNMKEPGWQWTEYQRPLERFLYLNADAEEEQCQVGTVSQPCEAAKQNVRKLLTTQEAEKRQQSLF
ncbi:3'-5' exoribonuclease YhaM family protein [Desulfogranum japonicum]|uniref:3'-5' exoribonuclease YhaM family protein n=1 Tax=Desulfogranum japonicum TaxID=231447 RepID=UPI00040B94D4|nr:3'-5' exoribonuclease YhaM family protein [Desulfogranum japonicum]